MGSGEARRGGGRQLIRMKQSFWFLALVVALVGCGPAKPLASTDPGTRGTTSEPGKADPGVDNPITPGGGDSVLHPAKKAPVEVTPLQHGKGSGGWETAKDMTPNQLAAKIDQAFSGLAAVQNDARVTFTIPSGSGQIKLLSKWQSPTKFSVQYLGIREGHPSLESVRSNGKNAATLLGYVKGVSVASGHEAWRDIHAVKPVVPGNGGKLVAGWPQDISRLAFGRFTLGQDVFVPLVSALKKDTSLEVTCEKRVVMDGQKPKTDYRILALRKEAFVKKKGDLEFEMVIDADHFVPVTMRTRSHPRGQKVTEVDWAGRWAGGKFDEKTFEIPKKSS